jgi:hypothetical protein
MLKPRKETIEVKKDSKENITCPECGSFDIEQKMWVNVNTLKLSSEPETGSHQLYCAGCQQSFRL